MLSFTQISLPANVTLSKSEKSRPPLSLLSQPHSYTIISVEIGKSGLVEDSNVLCMFIDNVVPSS